MANELSTGAPEPSYGKANPRRGAGHEDKAIQFVRDFPVGTTLTAEEFDSWAQGHGFVRPPKSTDKQSDGWQAYLQRRHQLKDGITKASTHPRMDTPFIIETLAMGVWEVRSPYRAISRTKMFDKIESVAVTRRKQLLYLMQSADWSVLPPHEKAFAESLMDDIDMFRQRLELEAEGLSNKFMKLERKLRKGVEEGQIQIRNGGIKGIIGRPKED